MFKRGKGENEYYYFFHNTGLQAQRYIKIIHNINSKYIYIKMLISINIFKMLLLFFTLTVFYSDKRH